MLKCKKFNCIFYRKVNLIFFRYEYFEKKKKNLKPTYLGTPSSLFEDDSIKIKQD